MGDTVIQVDDLWKKYRLGTLSTGTLAHDLNRWWARVRGRPDPHAKVGEAAQDAERRRRSADSASRSSLSAPPASGPAPLGDDEMWALRGVSFEVKQGDILGIIGRNGAGKSTLLKILSRTTAPTAGEIRLKGRVASLLEVGTGFHPELTGRENIFLNGAILGMTKAEIRRKFDEIVAFAEVEKFMDTPVKRYSSGMYVRLAFAVAAHLEPEILIVDEVLAVGDAEFQKKCLGKMGEVAKGGRTVLFVSHNMTAVQTLCRRALLLAGGRFIADDVVATVVMRYLREAQGPGETKEWTAPQTAPGNSLIRIKAVRILPHGGSATGLLTMQTPLRIETDYWVVKVGAATHLTYHLINEQGIVVLTSGCASHIRSTGLYQATCTIPGELLNSGGYFLKLLIVENENQVTYEKDGIASFTLVDAAERRHACMGREPGVVQPLLDWKTTSTQG
jgi:lipopolysaccharide transport system ATP-binding protein